VAMASGGAAAADGEGAITASKNAARSRFFRPAARSAPRDRLQEVERLVELRLAMAEALRRLFELEPLVELAFAALAFAEVAHLVFEGFHVLALVEAAEHLFHARAEAHAGGFAEAAEEAGHLAWVLFVAHAVELARHRLHGAFEA